MKKEIKITLEKGKSDYIALLPVIAFENNRLYRSLTIGVQFLKKYAEMIFTFWDWDQPTNQPTKNKTKSTKNKALWKLKKFIRSSVEKITRRQKKWSTRAQVAEKVRSTKRLSESKKSVNLCAPLSLSLQGKIRD